MSLNPIGLPLLLSSVILLAGAYRIWNLGFTRGERPFAFLLIACAFYSTAYAMEISSTDLDMILFWIKVEYLGIAFIPALIILFTLHYTGKAKEFSRLSLAALFVIPVITLILVFSIEHHSLVYQDMYLDTKGPFPVLGFTRGVWYWVHVLYILLGMLFSNLLLLQLWLNTNPTHRKQISIVLSGSLIPWLGLIFYITRIIPWYIDLMPFFISISGFVIAWGLARHGLFELIPIARSKIFEELPDGALIVDPKMRILDFNYAAQHYLQLEPGDIGKLINTALGHLPELVESINSNSGKAELDLKFEKEVEKGEKTKQVWLRFDIISLQTVEAAIDGKMLIIRDITERKQFEEKLYYLSTTDELTGLNNRRYFIQAAADELEKAKRYQKYFTLILIDIDHFKTVNDNFGHTGGDEVLKFLGSLLRDRLRKADIAARLGGEEFGIILSETDLDQAYILAEQIRKKISSSPVNYEGENIYFTISAGVASSSSDTNSIEDLLRTADQALYQAKEKGRNMTIKNKP